jgi:hypothetical protein
MNWRTDAINRHRKDALAAKHDQFRIIWEEAQAAGQVAGRSLVPVPMVVGSPPPDRPFSNEVDPNQPREFVADGVCGFAWVKIRPATSSFVRWLKSHDMGRKDVYGGWSISVMDYNQSMQKKEAHAQAMAEVFRKHGINAYAQSRMD